MVYLPFNTCFLRRIRRYTEICQAYLEFGICAVFPRFLKYIFWELAKAGYAENVAADCAAGSRKREGLKQDRGLSLVANNPLYVLEKPTTFIPTPSINTTEVGYCALYSSAADGPSTQKQLT